MKLGNQRYVFDAPGAYRIRVQGHVAAHWTDTLGGMAILSRGAQGKAAVTTLTGTLIDQACLMGVLTALYEMGYTLLDVKRLPEPARVGPGDVEYNDECATAKQIQIVTKGDSQ